MKPWPLVSAVGIAVGLSGLWTSPALAQNSATVEWGCDAPAARTCYFSILSTTGAVRSFSLLSGRRIEVPSVTPGRDQYLVSVDTPNLGDLIHCRQLTSLGHLCQRKTVDFGYND